MSKKESNKTTSFGYETVTEEQKTEKEDQEYQEMSIESGVPDLENQVTQTDKDGEEIEVEDKSQSDFRRNIKKNMGDLRYKVYTEEFDEIIKAEEAMRERYFILFLFF